MTATTLDMRYRTHDLFESLARGVQIVITYRGKKAGILSPYREEASMSPLHITEHPFFGSEPGETHSVEEVVDSLRGGRYDDI